MSTIRRALLLVVISVVPLSLISAPPSPAKNKPRPRLESAQTCKECHERQYSEWMNSAHAHFSRKENVPFLRLSERAGGPNKNISRCQACHEPLRQFQDSVSDSKIIAKERISCDLCHSVSIDHARQKFKLHPSGAKQGPTGKGKSPKHAIVHSKEIASADFCLVCHHKSRNDHRKLRKEFPTELVNCKNCHMPLRTDGAKGRSHAFPGRYSEEMLQKAFQFDVAIQEADGGLQIDVRMKNIVNAHSVPPAPKGYSHIVLLVSAHDVSNRIVWKNWDRKPSKEPVFSTIHADSRGRVPAAIYVKAKESKEFQYLVKGKPIGWVEARLVAYAVAPGQVASMGLKEPFYTKGRTMAFKRFYLDKRN